MSKWRINMKIMKKIGIFALVIVLLFSFMSVSVLAAEPASDGAADAQDGKLDMSLKPESFNDRLGYAVQGTVTGILMVFAVLVLLTLILYVSKYVFYDIPNRDKEKARDVENAASVISATPVAATAAPAPAEDSAPAPTAVDDGELAAVITAAIAAMIESGEYKNEFVGGFRVVSFKRSANSAWNKR